MEKLTVLWTTDSIETIESMLVPYCSGSLRNEWWSDVRIILWGASVKAATKSNEIVSHIKDLLEKGISIEACKFCTDKYGASDMLIELGVDVKYTGSVLTEYLKDAGKVLTI